MYGSHKIQRSLDAFSCGLQNKRTLSPQQPITEAIIYIDIIYCTAGDLTISDGM